jgi:DNA-binding MarR family transcriptional regulator
MRRFPMLSVRLRADAVKSTAGKLVNVVNDVALDPTTVANRLRPVLLKLGRELRREVHPLGVTGGQASLLVQIRMNPGIGVRGLAARERMSPAGMSGHVKRLERAGLVSRAADQGDLRRQGLSLTPAGERVLRSVRSRRTAWLSSRLKGLPDEELEAIDAAIEPLARLLEEEDA